MGDGKDTGAPRAKIGDNLRFGADTSIMKHPQDQHKQINAGVSTSHAALPKQQLSVNFSKESLLTTQQLAAKNKDFRPY